MPSPLGPHPHTVLGTTDDTTTCDCCGRTNLKATVVIRDADGDVAYLGRTCASRATGWRAAHLDRQTTTATAAADRARETVADWTRFLGPSGLDLFLARNPHSLRFHRDRAGVAAFIEATLADAHAVLAPLAGQRTTH